MRKSRFSILQIETILKEAASGIKIAELCLKHGISVPTFYVWKAKSQSQKDLAAAEPGEDHESAREVSRETAKDMADMRQNITNLENENELLRKLFVELSLDQASARLQEETSLRKAAAETVANSPRQPSSSPMLINTSIYKKS